MVERETGWVMGVDDCLMAQTMIACHSVFVSLVNKRAKRAIQGCKNIYRLFKTPLWLIWVKGYVHVGVTKLVSPILYKM